MNELNNYDGDMDKINNFVSTGVIVVPDMAKLKTGKTKDGDTWINQFTFRYDDVEGKQASFFCSAFGETADKLLTSIESAPIGNDVDGNPYKGPMFRVLVEGKPRRSDYTETNAVTGVEENKIGYQMTISKVWSAPVKSSVTWAY
tara:strand:+ start:184 stop:618 length:435 start_codon:yes stop_codon:yes gene_type:complete